MWPRLRASGCGYPGAPATPITTSSSPTFDEIATPFHRLPVRGELSTAEELLPSNLANASSLSFVSCKAHHVGLPLVQPRQQSRYPLLIEFTFQVANRTNPR